MSTMLEKAGQQIEAGDYKAARQSLWNFQREMHGGDIESAQGLLDLASSLHECTTGSARRDCNALMAYAREALDRATHDGDMAKAVALGIAEFLGGSDGRHPGLQGSAELAFTPKRVLFGKYEVASMSDVDSIEIVGDQQTKSKVGATVLFGVAGGLAAKGTVDRTEIGVHLKSGAVPYFRVLKKNRIEVRAKLGPVLREAEVPFLDEVLAQAQQPDASPMDEIGKAFELFKAGALTEEEFKAAKERLLG